LEKNEELRKAIRDLKSNSDTSRSSETAAHKLTEISLKAKDFAFEMYGRACELSKRVLDKTNETKATFQEATEKYQYLRITKNGVLRCGRGVSHIYSTAIDFSKNVTEFFNEEKRIANEKLNTWREQMAVKRQQQQQDSAASSSSSSKDDEFSEDSSTSSSNFSSSERKTDDDNTGDKDNNNNMTYDLVLTEKSAWDRFGTHLRDMPFLKNFLENPVLGKIFGETEQAAALREMKAIDPTFRLSELVESVQYVVAPHVLDSFLQGDEETLRIHCGEAAYGAVSQSIRERKTLELTLDPTVLLLRSVELKGAVRVDNDAPMFIFNFVAQQINCLRDKKQRVIVGAVDDIREVEYCLALTRHPEPSTKGLHYPWLVKEIAIVGNQPSW